jgi:hypothetical protein
MIRELLRRWRAMPGADAPSVVLPESWDPATRGHLHLDCARSNMPWIGNHFPRQASQTVAAAERFLAHRFNLLGSGTFQPRDPARPPREGYEPIDWSLDPKANKRFPDSFESARWSPALCPPGADIKYVWELGRCQHFVTLAQAWLLTGDERFRNAVVGQAEDFLEASPVGRGVQWICTMDVSLRAMSWGLAFDVLCPAEPDERWRELYAALFEHAGFIRSHLENAFEVTSNHFLSNVAALLFLGCVFRATEDGREWLEFACAALERELHVQVLPDGADFESSVPYHRLVTELFLTCLRAADLNDVTLSSELRGRVAAMARFHYAVLRPDGRMPQVGDADDGRAHLFLDDDRRDPQDGRHLLGPASALFGELSWSGLDETARWEAAWWGFRPETSMYGSLGDVAALFPDAGVAVVRRGGDYLVVTNGPVGTRGFGNHKHNDQLSFELHVAGVPLFVDPGSYVYTADAPARNAFRSTASHNTLQVDDVEQHDFKPEWLFRMFAAGVPSHQEFHADDRVASYQGTFDGYRRLPEPLLHERRFAFDFAARRLVIRDTLTGTGEHSLRWRFHCAPGVSVTVEERTIRLESAAGFWTLECPADVEPRVERGWYSPSYGVRTPCAVVTAAATARIEGSAQWTFRIRPRLGA